MNVFKGIIPLHGDCNIDHLMSLMGIHFFRGLRWTKKHLLLMLEHSMYHNKKNGDGKVERILLGIR
uniref:Uncharacterized protein n=1 Tax=uncultured marine virus TaxID=186617 RepID=A0A0F7L5L1_9VIRU|nr:hypothetical protein [uncultured marine virus]